MLVELREVQRDSGEDEPHIAALAGARAEEAASETVLLFALLCDRMRDGRLPGPGEAVDPEHGCRFGDVVDRLVGCGDIWVFQVQPKGQIIQQVLSSRRSTFLSSAANFKPRLRSVQEAWNDCESSEQVLSLRDNRVGD